MIENVKIMVISPEASVREFVADVLEFSVNRHVIGIENAAQALACIDAQGEMDIVICADALPDMPGRNLLVRVKQKSPDSIRVLMVSGDHGPVPATDSIIAAYLKPPTDSKALFDLVQRFVVDGEKR
jgi:DNA-binding NtrC family response regulator